MDSYEQRRLYFMIQQIYNKMNMKVWLVVLGWLTTLDGHKYKCHFNDLYDRQRIKPSPSDQPDETLWQNRNLQTVTRAPIRITLDTTDFNTIKTTDHGQAETTTANLNFIKKSMQVTEVFFENRLQVSTMARVIAPATCADYTPSANDQSTGISSSDLHIYVLYITDQNQLYRATGKSCKYINSNGLPDMTLQQGRPTVGRMKYNTYRIIDQQTSLTNRLFADLTATSIHETIHILGFDYSLYSTYLDPDTGNVYSTPTASTTLHASRGQAHHMMQTPFVTAWAKEHFDCSSLTGIPLENEDDSANISTATPGSHWERVTMYDELMTATQLGAHKGISGLTFAMLKDMGWYDVDDTFNDTTNYGYHLGCNFVNDACYGSSYPKYFCDTAAYENVSVCSTTFLGKAICTDQASLMSDGCGMFAEYFHCVDPAESDDGYKSYTLETYGTGSFCVDGTLSNVGISSKYRGRCYPYQCLSNSVKFTIQTNTVQCLSSEAGTRKTLSSLDGYLQCPNFDDYCTNSRKICPNWCSQNGYCTRGICNCYTGYYGDDCSKTSCTTGQYYDQTTEQCVSSCPSGTYENQYSHACLLCDSSCQECRDQPTICTGCLSTPQNPQYFHVSSSECLSECPSDTYTSGDNCEDCSAADFCAECSYAPDNCTACSGGKFLENPDYGTCIDTCSGANSLYDVVNYKCVSTCADNLVYYSPLVGWGGLNGCDMCANGTYKLIDDQACHADCPATYYQNEDTRFCEKCHASCEECDGGFAENCTKCSSSSSEKYLLLKMCVSSCPRGFYTNDAAGACQICTIQLNCATCQYQSAEVKCLTCKYGYYLQANQTCLTQCDQYMYKNRWNHSCDDCSGDCGDCETPDASACTSCRSPKYYLTNISGGYCLNVCPTERYVTSGSNCLECYDSCESCSGVSSSDCLTCIEGYYLSEGMCRLVCPPATYPDSSSGTCNLCDGSCTFCFGPTIDNCTACIQGLVLNNFTCTDSCPEDLTLNQFGVCFQEFLSLVLLPMLFMLMI